ncbi:MAG: hypothetical protein ACHBN1_26480 [Heteroscytonema crispum UTEX LB 1556]
MLGDSQTGVGRRVWGDGCGGTRRKLLLYLSPSPHPPLSPSI